MIPLFAATSAISSVGSVGATAISQWKNLTGSAQTDSKQKTSATSGSFSALLSAHGVDVGSNSSGPTGLGAAGVRPVG